MTFEALMAVSFQFTVVLSVMYDSFKEIYASIFEIENYYVLRLVSPKQWYVCTKLHGLTSRRTFI